MQRGMTPQNFVEKWRRAEVSERAGAQSHFNDLCALLGQQTPLEADATGRWYAFEKKVQKVTGGQGFADVWRRGAFAWEYKKKHANLDAAYQQLLLYREALENPPLLVVSDIERIEVHTNFTNTVRRTETFGLEDLLNPARLDLLRKVWTEPEAFRSRQTTEEVTREAAREFAKLAEVLRKWGAEATEAAHFLIRLLFCMFAEDVGLLPERLFTRIIEASNRNPESIESRLRQLFAAMRTGGPYGADDILYFNGGWTRP